MNQDTKAAKTKPGAAKGEVGTTGHDWDGITELNNPLPRWWLWTFYATVIWGLAYTVAYPAWPMLSRATSGMLGWSTRAEVAAEIGAVNSQNAALDGELAKADLATLIANPDDPIYHYALASGAAVFRTNCAQCHGSGAAGAKGYPNLLDTDWLWGGKIEDIATTISHGVRNADPDTRFSQMPAFGEILEPDQIDGLVNHVLALSGQEHDATKAAVGAALFGDNCASCHGEQAKGDREQGAPNLTDAIWLYGSDPATVTETITKARFGVMPAWGQRLDAADLNAVAAYVHELGGGE